MESWHPLRTPRSGSSGVGFLDLLLVVTIVAILAAVAVPAFGSNELVLEGATRQVVADMLEAQSLAIESRRPMGLRFDPGTNSCVFILESGETPAAAETTLRVDPDLSEAEVDRLLEARATGDPKFDSVVLADAVLGAGSDLIFEADGSPRFSGLVDLSRDGLVRRIRVQIGGGRIAVTEP